jgi:uncharacterized membrane protein
MPQAVQNYSPQTAQIEQVKRLAFVAWSAIAFVVLLWLALIVAPPFLQANNFAAAAKTIYLVFSFVCHQINERAFHLFEHPFAVCARCFGVYAGLAAGVLLYPLFRTIYDTQPLPRIVLLAAPIPTTIDFALGYFDIWENTHFSRFFTAAILGIACAFFVVPGVVEIMRFVFLKKLKTAFPIVPRTDAPSDYSRPDLRI